MSNKLAIVDIDGVLCDTTVRFSRASDAKTAVLQQHIHESDPERVKAIVQQATDEYWRVAFTPDLLALDTPIPGVSEALDQIDLAGYQIVLLSSRIEALREATLDWFYLWQSSVFDRVYCGGLYLKPPAFQFVKTAVWKAGITQMLAAQYGAEEVLFVDDDEQNRDAVLQHAGTYPLVRVAESLDAAVALVYPHWNLADVKRVAEAWGMDPEEIEEERRHRAARKEKSRNE